MKCLIINKNIKESKSLATNKLLVGISKNLAKLLCYIFDSLIQHSVSIQYPFQYITTKKKITSKYQIH